MVGLPNSLIRVLGLRAFSHSLTHSHYLSLPALGHQTTAEVITSFLTQES